MIPQGFFLGCSPCSENFARPPNQPPSPFFDQSLSPPTEFCSRKFQKFYLILSQFWVLFSSKLHQKALDLFYASADNFSKSPLIGLRPRYGPKNCPRKQAPPPHQKFCEKNPVCWHCGHDHCDTWETGLQKMFSLSGTIKVMGKIFCQICARSTHHKHIPWSPYERGSGQGHFDALWCNLHLYLNIFCVNIIIFYFLVMNIFCGVHFLEKVNFRSQILECPSIGQYWNIFGVPVLPENVILTFFRTC